MSTTDTDSEILGALAVIIYAQSQSSTSEIVQQRLRRRRLHLLQEYVQNDRRSQWAFMKRCNLPDSQLQAFTCLDIDSFEVVLRRFAPMYDRRHIRPGRPPKFRAMDALALTLHYLRGGASQKELCYIFGATEGVISRYLMASLVDLVAVLENLPDSTVLWYTNDELDIIHRYAMCHASGKPGDALRALHDDFDVRVVGMVDGYNVYAAQPVDSGEQRDAYSGYEGTAVCSNVFFTCIDGCIIAYHVNHEGCAADASVCSSSLIELKLNGHMYLAQNMVIVADDGFPHGREYAGIMAPLTPSDTAFVKETIRELHAAPIPNMDLISKYNGLLARSKHICSVRQGAEWTNADLSQTFRILQSGRLTVSKFKRMLILRACCHLYNLRVRRMRIGHVRSTFMAH